MKEAEEGRLSLVKISTSETNLYRIMHFHVVSDSVGVWIDLETEVTYRPEEVTAWKYLDQIL